MVSSRTLIVECGADRVGLGVFSSRGDRLCLHHLAFENFATGRGSGESEWVENTRLSLRILADRTKISGVSIFVLPAHLTLTKLIKIPRVEPAQREKIIRFEAEQAIPYALADVVWGCVIVGESDTDLEVLIATAKREVVEPLCAAAYATGFEPRLLLPSVFATLAGFKLMRPGKAEPFLGLNLAPRSTTLLLVESGHFAARTFAFGADGGAGRTTSPGLVATVNSIDSITMKLIQEVTRSLLHFQWRSGMTKPGRVLIGGLGAHLPGLTEALSSRLKIPVTMHDLKGSIDFANAAAQTNAAAHADTLIDLCGAACTQLRQNQPIVNLLPPLAVRRANFRRRRLWLVAAAVLSTTVMLPPLIHFRQLREAALRKTAAIEHELKPWRERVGVQKEVQRTIGELNERLRLLREIDERRSGWLRLLADLQVRLFEIEDVWLDELHVVPAAKGDPIKLLISGRLLDRAHPLSKASPEAFGRVKSLLARIAAASWVTSVEAERLDFQQPGLLKFDFVLTVDSRWPL